LKSSAEACALTTLGAAKQNTAKVAVNIFLHKPDIDSPYLLNVLNVIV
jgi:hypothetical protein